MSGKGSNGTGMGKQYMTFVRNNMDQIAKRITDDLWVLSAMEVNRVCSEYESERV